MHESSSNNAPKCKYFKVIALPCYEMYIFTILRSTFEIFSHNHRDLCALEKKTYFFPNCTQFAMYFVNLLRTVKIRGQTNANIDIFRDQNKHTRSPFHTLPPKIYFSDNQTLTILMKTLAIFNYHIRWLPNEVVMRLFVKRITTRNNRRPCHLNTCTNDTLTIDFNYLSF